MGDLKGEGIFIDEQKSEGVEWIITRNVFHMVLNRRC